LGARRKSAAEIAAPWIFEKTKIGRALRYIETYPEEIAATIADNEAAFDALFQRPSAERTARTSATASLISNVNPWSLSN